MQKTLAKLRTRALARASETNEAGFTLLELIIVLSIIAIITAISIPVYGDIRHKSRVSRVASVADNAYSAAMVAIEDGEVDTYATTVVGQVDSANPNVTITVDNFGGYENLEGRFLCVETKWDVPGDHVPSVTKGEGCSFRVTP